MTERNFTFGSLERSSLLAGWSAGQVAVTAVGLLVALVLVRDWGAPLGLALALAVAGSGAGVARLRIGGFTALEWFPTLVVWLGRGVRGRRAHTSHLPESGMDPKVAPVGRHLRPAGPLGELALTAHSHPDGRALGVLHDQAANTIAAAVAVASQSLALGEGHARHDRAATWGRLLASLAKDGSPLVSLQWIERRMPTGLANHEIDSADIEAGARYDGARLRAAESYGELLAQETGSAWSHECVVVVCVSSDRKGATVPGTPAYALLARYLDSLERAIGEAGIGEPCLLGPLALEGWIRRTFLGSEGLRRSRASSRAVGGGIDGRTPLVWPWPLAVESGWSTLRTDGTWHATYWIAEWPRVGVGPDFLAPLLLWRGGRRTIAMTMKPVPPGKAERDLERTRTANMADAKLRERGGFLTSVRTRKEAEHVGRMARDLADGHAEYRFSAYLALSADSEEELKDAAAGVEVVASRCGLELRRLYGRVEEVFTYTLPTGRGVR